MFSELQLVTIPVASLALIMPEGDVKTWSLIMEIDVVLWIIFAGTIAFIGCGCLATRPGSHN